MDPNIILNTIKDSGIKPISRKHFIIKRILVISLGVMITILGGIVFAKIIADIFTTSWQDWDYVFTNFRSFIYFMMPISWMLLLVVFTGLIPFVLEKTAQGYKYKKIILILFSVLASVVMGLIFLKIGSYTGINKILITSSERKEAIIWTKPSQGRLSGHIIEKSTESIILQDFRNNIWAIDIQNVLDLSKKVVDNSPYVKIVGIEIDENTFLACQILPFEISSFPEIEPEESTIKNDFREPDSVKDICGLILKQ